MKRLNKNYFIVFIYLCVLCFLFPWVDDDWGWGSTQGMELLGTFFKDYNGRYLGNLLVITLTRSRILRVAVMVITYTALLYLIANIAGDSKGRLSMIAILLLCMPSKLFAQAIAWTSGFANYVPSIVISLLYIFLVRDIFESNPPVYKHYLIPVNLLLGVAGSLFIEHVAIYNLCLGVFVLVYAGVRFKRVYPAHIAFLAGSIAGAALMFSNGAYRAVAQHTDWYRSMAQGLKGIAAQAFTNFAYAFIPYSFLGCLVLMLALGSAAVFLSIVMRNRISPRRRVWHDLSLAVIIAYTALALIESIGRVLPVIYWRYIEIAATVLYVMAWAGFILTLPAESVPSALKTKRLFFLGSAVVLDGSLLIVYPVSPRCMFASYVFLVVLAVSLLDLALEHVNVPKSASRVLCDALTVAMVICAYYFIYIYGTIAFFDNYRLEKARADIAAGNTTIGVKNMIFSEYVYSGDPTTDTQRETNFKDFYGIDPDIRIENVD